MQHPRILFIQMINIFSPTFCLVFKMIMLSNLDATSLTVVGYSNVDICFDIILHEKSALCNVMPFLTCSLWHICLYLVMAVQKHFQGQNFLCGQWLIMFPILCSSTVQQIMVIIYYSCEPFYCQEDKTKSSGALNDIYTWRYMYVVVFLLAYLFFVPMLSPRLF